MGDGEKYVEEMLYGECVGRVLESVVEYVGERMMWRERGEGIRRWMVGKRR
jgi:hypothetical protein